MAAGTLAEQFSELWNDDNPPDVVAFLNAHPAAAARERIDVLLVDQYRRWQSGDPWPAEQYFDSHPDLAVSDDAKLELIAEEFGYLEEREGKINRQAFFARFEGLSSRVKDQLQTLFPESSNGHGAAERLLPSAAAKNAPTQIGRYQVVREIGRGTFGIVYLATDSELQRDVAIKVPSRRQVDRAGGVDAFLREARAVATLDHSGIVPVYDVGTLDDGSCYVVSRYIEGQHLGERLRCTVFEQTEAIQLVIQLACSLDVAHRSGLVHRDIKPANILVDASDKPHLVDFGLALKDEDYGRGATLVGTPAYMSPEQARGEGHRVDARSDVYSLGVVLYELLTAQRPYTARTTSDLLDEIRQGDVRPPRQVNETISPALDRICLKALSRRVSDRYTTAAELADELGAYLAEATSVHPSEAAITVAASSATVADRSAENTLSEVASTASFVPGDSSSETRLKIIPKGLRAFDSADADFFRELLPGPRDRTGLPDSIRFWRNRINETEPEETFSVGLIYGPSGCGKSSLVRAGLLPALDEHVLTVYLEATADDTETGLLNALRRTCPNLPDDKGLVDSIAALRRPGVLQVGQKVVIVLDQFEQWLHSWHEGGNDDLLRGLLQCDGGRVQAVVMVRDDFWMAATRFMRELEVPLVEGHNAAAVDLFDVRHARRVLKAYGCAFGALPEGALSRSNELFIRAAVDGLAVDGKVICVRLALFAEMVKHKPWIPATLQQVGGTHGVGETFLEETFGLAAPPRFRVHSLAAKALLETLIPAAGSNIKASARSTNELCAAAQYDADPASFAELLQILNSELRLITPTSLEDSDSSLQPTVSSVEKPTTSLPPHEHCFQLAHDYLVPAIRSWLTRSQRRTLSGRAALQLRELADEWSNRPDRRYLPTLPEFVGIRTLTNPKTWNGTQRQMMSQATKHHLKRISLALLLTLAVCWLGYESYGRFQANAFVSRLVDASLAEVPEVLEEAQPYRRWLTPNLRNALENEVSGSAQNEATRREIALRMALLPDDDSQTAHLVNALLTSRPPEFVTIRDSLAPHKQTITHQLWEALSNPPPRTHNPRLQAAAALAHYDAENDRWTASTPVIANELVAVRPVYLDAWLEQLQPIGRLLIEPLTDVFHNAERDATERDAAAEALARYAANDVDRLCELALVADRRQFNALVPQLSAHREQAIAFFQTALDRDPWEWKHPASNPSWNTIPPELRTEIESNFGLVTDTFAFVVQMPYDKTFTRILETFKQAGYRPRRIRPYQTTKGLLAAAIWYRDGGDWETARDLTANELRQRHAEMTDRQYLAVDVAGYVRAGEVRYCALWHRRPPGLSAKTSLAVGLNEDELQTLIDDLVDDPRLPFTRQTFLDAQSQPRHCLLLREEKHLDNRWVMLAGDKSFYYEKRGLTRRQVDVTMWRDPTEQSEKPHALVAGLWFRGDTTKRSAAIMPNGGPVHLKSSRQFSAMDPGYIPAGISAAELVPGGAIWIASVWDRPYVSWRGLAKDSRRKASAAIALLHLGRRELVFKLLDMQPDPTLRSNIVDRLASLKVPADILLSRLSSEGDNSIRRALILAMAEYSHESLPAALRSEIVENTASLFEADPDAGIHAAAELLLNRYDESSLLTTIDQRLTDSPQSQAADWFVGPNGHCFSTVTAGEFLMGFRPGDEYRNSAAQQHTRRINRRYAIANKEVTVEQFSRFLETRPQLKEREGEGLTRRGGPQINLSFYLAVEYCNWLSKTDGLPESQWCYLPNEKGEYAVGMTIPADSLERTGYRLPTEGEWEFACRAGSETMYYFGESVELLSKYAWHAGTSGHRAHPVGQLRPNDFGLFDMLGNGIEVTHTPYYVRYVDIPEAEPVPKVIDDEVGEVTCVANMYFVTRGSGFEYEYYSQTSPRRSITYPHGRSRMMTFRVARTLPATAE